MIVFGGSNSAGLAWDVAKSMKAETGKTEMMTFPDGERYVRVATRISKKECAVIQSVRSNDDLVELLLLLDALRDQGAIQVHAIMPYLAYMRQDKVFKEGEAKSAKTILKMISEVCDSISTVNCHFLSGSEEAVYEHVRLMNLDAIPYLADYFSKKVKNPVFIAPDKGSLGYAKCAAQLLDCEFDHLSKKRISSSHVEIKMKDMDLKGHDAVILDDMISTGGTIIESAKVIRRGHPNSVNVGCVHGLFLSGIDSFKGSVDRLVSTDTLENPVSKVSTSRLISEYLLR